MKKFMLLFASLFCFIILLTACSNKESSLENDKDTASSLEVITPDYITGDNNQDSEVLATIYVSDIESDSIVNKKVKINKLTSDAIFTELKNENIIVSNTSINSFETFENQEKELVGVLNLSKEFYNFNLGSGYESLMLNSIAKTYIENFNLDKFKILVDNEEYESGHILIEKDEYFTKDSIEYKIKICF
ncbi:MAG: GerMN domain-containing protein [Peptostreptococcaceae bacterium]